MITIGITGAEQESGIINMLRKIMNQADLKFSIIESYDFHLSMLPSVSLKDYIGELKKNKTDIAIIKIVKEKLIAGMYHHIKFNILVYNHISDHNGQGPQHEEMAHEKKIFDAMDKEDIAIINIDDQRVLQLLRDSKMCVITYGLSSKATITASSIEADSDCSTFIYCLQRTLCTVEGRDIEPQEFPVRIISSKDKNTYNTLAAVTTALVCNADASVIQALIL